MLYGKLTKSFMVPTQYFAVGTEMWFSISAGYPGVWYRHPVTRRSSFKRVPKDKDGKPCLEVYILDPAYEKTCRHLLAGGGED